MANAVDQDTDYVYDYFIKDYLGNVRVVLTSEDAEETDHYLATMEQMYAMTEEDNFDGILETRDDVPYNYPYDGSGEFNEKISELTAIDDKKIGPAKVLPAKRGDKFTVSTRYFYVEDAPGQSYDNLTNLVEEILYRWQEMGMVFYP